MLPGRPTHGLRLCPFYGAQKAVNLRVTQQKEGETGGEITLASKKKLHNSDGAHMGGYKVRVTRNDNIAVDGYGQSTL